uniref:Uncharacterized protein n=1 Tax=Utricularia reniformis TaxID=192314 RepID=A0A1Y0AYS4_9LAMI|nr:hypothetical protein AEK19_MT0676 [Utricularia reniformis]ART30301.1 hypothetical protein AEK19_MT0676 [Utricularia reniformis]
MKVSLSGEVVQMNKPSPAFDALSALSWLTLLQHLFLAKRPPCTMSTTIANE